MPRCSTRLPICTACEAFAIRRITICSVPSAKPSLSHRLRFPNKSFRRLLLPNRSRFALPSPVPCGFMNGTFYAMLHGSHNAPEERERCHRLDKNGHQLPHSVPMPFLIILCACTTDLQSLIALHDTMP